MRDPHALHPDPSATPSMSESATRFLLAVRRYVQAELNFKKEDLKQSSAIVRRHLFFSVFFASFALLSILPLMGFMVILLGSFLNQNYALSCLITAIVFLSGGLVLSLYSWAKLAQVSLPSSHAGIEWTDWDEQWSGLSFKRIKERREKHPSKSTRFSPVEDLHQAQSEEWIRREEFEQESMSRDQYLRAKSRERRAAS